MKVDKNINTLLSSMTPEYRPFTVFLFIRAAVFAASTEDLHNLRNKTGKHCL